MRTATEKTLTKQRKAAPTAEPATESKLQPVAIVPRVVKKAACPTLNGKGELAYEIGVDGKGEAHLRVVENTGGTGSFSDDWVGFRNIQAAFDRAPKSEPVSAYMLHPLFRGKSSNCCYFCAAVLQSERLLLPSEKRKKRFDRVDPAAWLADIRGRAEGKAADATGETSSKKPAVPKAVASKPKKSNKAAKT